MADEQNGGKVFEAYYANVPDGVTEFTVGMKVKLTGKITKYVGTNGNITPEIKNGNVVILTDDGGQGGDNPTPVVGKEVTCAEAVTVANALADNASTGEDYSVTGYITNILGAVSTKTGTPQQSFWMADEKNGGKVFEAYYANVPDGVSEFTVGMKVKLTGKITKFVNASGTTPEIKNGTVVVLEDGNGGQGGNDEPQGDIQHITIAEFLAKADPNTTYELTGIVMNIANTTYGNFDLVEENGSIYIYGLLDLNGEAKKFESLGIVEGDIVTLTGKYTVFNDKPEIVNAQLVSITKGQGGGGGDDPTPQPGDDPVSELENGSFEEWVSAEQAAGWKSASSASNAVVEMWQGGRTGSFACLIKANEGTNMRLATQEMTLAAGTYVFSYYAKSASGIDAQARIGYVPFKADGSIGAYKYASGFVDINPNGWTLIENEFTLTEDTKLCLIIMNPKSNANANYTSQDILVDDATLTKK